MSRITADWNALPLLLSTEEAAVLLRVHVNTVKALCRSGKLPAAKIGRAWRIHRSDLLAFTGSAEASQLLSQAAERLRLTNAELEAILSAVPAGLIVYDQDGRISRMNDLALDMLSYQKETWTLPVSQRIGAKVVAYNPDGSLCRRDQYVSIRALRGEVVRNEDQYIHLPERPDKDFWAVFSAGPIWGQDGELAGAVVIMSDTSKLHELNKQLAGVLHSLEEREAALVETNRQLQERTGALREAAERLEQRVQERTEALVASREQLQALSRRLVDIQERERRYVADQLYNEAGQVLVALRMHLSRGPGGTDEAQYAAQAQELLDRVMQDLHHLATHLRPVTLDRLGLVSALRQYAQEWGREHRVPVEFRSEGLARPALSGQVETAVYRVVQEALMNVAQHARASRVSVTVRAPSSGLSVTVSDVGVGFDPAAALARGATGLLEMRERAESVGGRLIVDSVSGSGTKVIVEAPIDRGAQRSKRADPGLDSRQHDA